MERHRIAAALFLSCSFLSFTAIAEGFYVGVEAGQGRTQLNPSSTSVFTRGVLLDTSSDRKDTTAGLYAGYTFAKYFGVELGYADLGEATYTTVTSVSFLPPFPYIPYLGASNGSSYSGVIGAPVASLNPVFNAGAAPIEQQTLTMKSKALSLAIVGRYPIAGEFSLLGRAGLAAHQTKSSIGFTLDGNPIRVIGGKRKTSAGAGVIGLGGEWAFHPNWAARLQAQRHFLLEDDDLYPVDRGDATLLTGGIEYRF